MRRETRKKLSLNRETLKNLDADSMSRVVGGAKGQSATAGQVCCSFPSDDGCFTQQHRCLPGTCDFGKCFCLPRTGVMG